MRETFNNNNKVIMSNSIKEFSNWDNLIWAVVFSLCFVVMTDFVVFDEEYLIVLIILGFLRTYMSQMLDLVQTSGISKSKENYAKIRASFLENGAEFSSESKESLQKTQILSLVSLSKNCAIEIESKNVYSIPI